MDISLIKKFPVKTSLGITAQLRYTTGSLDPSQLHPGTPLLHIHSFYHFRPHNHSIQRGWRTYSRLSR